MIPLYSLHIDLTSNTPKSKLHLEYASILQINIDNKMYMNKNIRQMSVTYTIIHSFRKYSKQSLKLGLKRKIF
ncbi:hypothetical protein BACCAP_04318 [Pseudoflavonifractor capillosus ATCC 29799]|uniref:Uncharacterized protein n=1 Tax=Pseudoflavonifractor capillosus ATCC 29799 TaxID=411467 RepID=A6P1F1_9FIRM|nr:hypothetical protein BACCAP_04318 [Pseudoflavonifractor capillosus ATCC 29799]